MRNPLRRFAIAGLAAALLTPAMTPLTPVRAVTVGN